MKLRENVKGYLYKLSDGNFKMVVENTLEDIHRLERLVDYLKVWNGESMEPSFQECQLDEISEFALNTNITMLARTVDAVNMGYIGDVMTSNYYRKGLYSLNCLQEFCQKVSDDFMLMDYEDEDDLKLILYMEDLAKRALGNLNLSILLLLDLLHTDKSKDFSVMKVVFDIFGDKESIDMEVERLNGLLEEYPATITCLENDLELLKLLISSIEKDLRINLWELGDAITIKEVKEILEGELEITDRFIDYKRREYSENLG